MRTPLVAAAAATIVLVGPAFMAGSSSAAPARDEASATTLAKGLVSPLSVAAQADGTRFFSENFARKLRTQEPGGAVTTLFKGPKGSEVGAVSEAGGLVTFAISKGNNARGTI